MTSSSLSNAFLHDDPRIGEEVERFSPTNAFQKLVCWMSLNANGPYANGVTYPLTPRSR